VRRATLFAIVGALVLALTAGVAFAATFYGTSGPDRIQGTSGDDFISGAGGGDFLSGNSGRDNISGGSGGDDVSGGYGNDRIYGGLGDDHINPNDDAEGDYVDCGPGYDTVDQMPTVLPDGAPSDGKRDVLVNCELIAE